MKKILLTLFALLLLAVQVEAKSVKLAWDANAPDQQVEGYNIYYGQDSWDEPLKKDAGNSTTTIIEDLEEGKCYRFFATAYKGDVESDLSNEAYLKECDAPIVSVGPPASLIGEELCEEPAIPVNRPPVPEISSPEEGSTHKRWRRLTFKGDAEDPDDGTLPPTSFNWTWRVNNGKWYKLASRVKSGTRKPRSRGNYEIKLVVTDSEGLKAETTVKFKVQ